MAGGSRRERRAKRKDISSRESNQPESKKREKGQNDSDFTSDLLQSLHNEDVRDAFKSILTEPLLERIQELEEINQANNDRITALVADLQRAHMEKSEIASELQDLLQYTRRNALRISNPNWVEPQPPMPGQSPEDTEDTDALVLGLAATLGVPLQPWEIGRSHRVGKPRLDGTPRPVLVKFISYNVRHRVYEARKLLKDKPSLKKVYFNEDLTRENGKLAYEARQMKKRGQLADTFTRDGRIYVKKFTNQRPKVVKDMDHLMSVALTPTYNDVTTTTRPMDRNRRNGSTIGTVLDAGAGATNEGPDANGGAMAAVATPDVAHPGDNQKTSTPSDAHQDEQHESPDLDATMASESLLPPARQSMPSLLSGVDMNNRYELFQDTGSDNESDTY